MSRDNKMGKKEQQFLGVKPTRTDGSQKPRIPVAQQLIKEIKERRANRGHIGSVYMPSATLPVNERIPR